MGRLLLARKDELLGKVQHVHRIRVVSGSCADLIKSAMIKAASVLPASVLVGSHRS